MTEIDSILVTGASRGIGLEFIKQFLTNPLVKTRALIATCRTPEKATALQELKKNHSNLHILKLDVSDFDTFDALAEEVQKIVGSKGLTLLVNNAGVISTMRSLDEINAEDFISILKTNSVGPVMLIKALRPLLKLSAEANSANKNNDLRVSKAAVINISSDLGSIQYAGGKNPFKSHCYRESKAALNMSTKTLSIELGEEGILVESIHPGVVSTDMAVQCKADAQIDTVTSVTGMLKVMLNLKSKNKDGFYSYTGEILPF